MSTEREENEKVFEIIETLDGKMGKTKSVEKSFKRNGNEDSTSIIIVGAGVSGITAASKLFQNGFRNIKILEAENRIGGCIHTIKFGDYLVEMGAQYVFGEEGNVTCKLASPFGLLESGKKVATDMKMLQSSGNSLDQSDVDDLIQFYDKTEDGLYEYVTNNKNSVVGKYYENEINKYVETHQKWQQNKKWLMNVYTMSISQLLGTNTLDDVSTVTFSEFEACPGDCSLVWKKPGHIAILDIIMKRFPNPKEELPIVNNTILNAEVSLIDYSDPNGKVRVKTTSGETYSADHVIVTCSLGVLKDRHKSLFKPALPEEKQKVIENLPFGNVSKIFFYFDEPWWSTVLAEYNLMWKDEELEMLEKDNEKRWLQGLTVFYSFEDKPKLLFTLVGGQPSRDMEKLTDEQVKTHCIEVFQRFFGKIYKVTNPSKMIRTMWHNNRNFKGVGCCGYSKLNPGIFTTKTLSKPVGEGKPVVLFAGESTSPNYFGMVHGAIESGLREADRIIKQYPNLEKN